MNESPIISPQRDPGEPQIPATGIFCIVPSEIRFLLDLCQALNPKRHYLFNSNLLVIEGPKGPFFVAGPAVGAPMAVLALEKLIALGAQNIIYYGWCGSLTRKIQINELILPTWAVSEEGTSRHYPIADKALASHRLNHALQQYLRVNAELAALEGPIWSTDAPYRETREKVEKYSAQGILAVEMEMSALLTVATYRKIEASGLLLVSDELYHQKWNPGFKRPEFRRKSKQMLQALLNFMQKNLSISDNKIGD